MHVFQEGIPTATLQVCPPGGKPVPSKQKIAIHQGLDSDSTQYKAITSVYLARLSIQHSFNHDLWGRALG